MSEEFLKQSPLNEFGIRGISQPKTLVAHGIEALLESASISYSVIFDGEIFVCPECEAASVRAA